MDVPPLLLIARALQFWAVATLLGGAGFLVLLGDGSQRGRRLLRVASAVAGLSGAAWFAASFVEIVGDWSALRDASAWQAFLAAPFGPPWAIRLGLCLAALMLAAGRNPVLFLVLGAGFAIDQAWLGHAAMASGGQAALQIASYWLHVFAGFAWTGALVMISTLALEARRVPPRGLALFSTIGIVVVAILVISGGANAVFRGVTPANLLTTGYGRLLALKLTLFAGMGALALVNRRNARWAGERQASTTVWLEAALGFVVLGVAAALGTTPPPNG